MFKNKKRAVIFVVMVLILLGLLVKQSIEELTINKFGHFVKGPEFKDGIGSSYSRHSHIQLPDGRIVIFDNYSGRVRNLKFKSKIYDPKTNTLKVIDILPDKDWEYTGITIDNKALLLITKEKNKLESVLYDITENKIVKSFGYINARPYILVGNRYIVYFSLTPKDEIRIQKLDITTNKLTHVLTINTKEFVLDDFKSCVEIDKDKIFIYGCRPYILDIKNNKFEKLESSIKRCRPVTIKLSNSDILIFGGREVSTLYYYKNTCVPVAEVLDHKTLELKHVGRMKIPRCSYMSEGAGATLMNDGRVFIAGGQTVEFGKKFRFQLDIEETLRSTEIYNPKTNTFELSANLKEKRTDAKLVTLKNGDIFVYNGSPSRGAYCLKTTEIFKIKIRR